MAVAGKPEYSLRPQVSRHMQIEPVGATSILGQPQVSRQMQVEHAYPLSC